MAIVVEGKGERLFLDPSPEHEQIALTPKVSEAPEALLPEKALGFRVQAYGMTRWRDLFTLRQLKLLVTLSDLIGKAQEKIKIDALAIGLPDDGVSLENGGTGAKAYSDAVSTYLGLSASKAAAFHTSLARWRPAEAKTAPAFGRQAFPMIWDFAESNPFGRAGGDLLGIFEGAATALRSVPSGPPSTVFLSDASELKVHRNSVIVATDPPYYDNIGYADLSDYFYIWLRKSLQTVYPSLMSTMLTPKERELIASPYRQHRSGLPPKDFFESGLFAAFTAIKNAQVRGMPIIVYYAFKQEESDEDVESSVSSGWDTMLSGLLRAGFMVNATWPVRTEGTGRLNNIGANALASSIVICCRERSGSSPIAMRNELLSTLRQELPEKIKFLQQAAIPPVDLAQSSIGPGMSVFSRYEKIIEADGAPMSVRTSLGLINQVLDEVLATEEADYDADTRWAITWFTQYGFERAVYGDAETLSKARNTSVQGLEEAGIVEARAGKVRLLKRDELGAWHPTTDDRFTIWEACQHLIKTLELDGEVAAARLLKQLDSRADAARDLAYRLYQHCDRKGDAEEARAYNGLVVAWPRLAALAAEEPRPVAPTLDFT